MIFRCIICLQTKLQVQTVSLAKAGLYTKFNMVTYCRHQICKKDLRPTSVAEDRHAISLLLALLTLYPPCHRAIIF